MFHAHIFLVSPLGSSNVTQSRTNKHQSRVPVIESPDNTGSAAYFPVQPLNDIVGADACSVFKREIHVSQSFLNAIFNLFSSFF